MRNKVWEMMIEMEVDGRLIVTNLNGNGNRQSHLNYYMYTRLCSQLCISIHSSRGKSDSGSIDCIELYNSGPHPTYT